jgi:type IV pilus assembly protein PilE
LPASGDERTARRDWRRQPTAAQIVKSFTIGAMVAARVHKQAGRRAIGGFTLIELMIVVVVIAVLAAIALPSYLSSVRKSRRADAITSLNQIAQAQERWRANNATYTTVLTNAGLNVANPSSGYYTLAAASASGTGYTATATAAGSQAGDAQCTTLTLVLAGGNVTYGSTGSATANQCWSR